MAGRRGEIGQLAHVDRPATQQQQEQRRGDEGEQAQTGLPGGLGDGDGRQQQHAGARCELLVQRRQQQAGDAEGGDGNPGEAAADLVVQRLGGEQRKVQRGRGGHEECRGPGVGADARAERQQHPDRAGDRAAPAEPDPGGVAHHRQRRGGDEQQVTEQAGQRRIVGLHQRRGDEGADDADRGDQLAVPQRQCKSGERRRGHQAEAGQGWHQRIQHARAVAGAEQDRDAAGRQGRRRMVGDPGRDVFPPPHPLRPGDQRQPEQSGQGAARPRPEQALLRRVADQEDAGHDQRHGAKPDAPAHGQQGFEVNSL